MGYIENVVKAAECNMMAAIEEIQCLPHYSTKGEVRMYRYVCYTVYIYIHCVYVMRVRSSFHIYVIICCMYTVCYAFNMSFAYRNLLLSPLQWVIVDARHDSTANAYHTTVPCLSGRYARCTIAFVSRFVVKNS